MTPPVADLLAAMVDSGFLGALPPMNLVGIVLAMASFQMILMSEVG